MISNYYRNKERAVFVNTMPTLTDQSQAHDTDVNVIIKKYTVTGTVPGAPNAPQYLDTTQFPQDLREVLEGGRAIKHYRQALPEQLRRMPIEQLLALTPEEITKLVKPEEPKERIDAEIRP